MTDAISYLPDTLMVTMTTRRTAIVWLRNDLRYHDNEALKLAHSLADYLLPVYCVDPRHYKAPGDFVITRDLRTILWFQALKTGNCGTFFPS